MALLAQVFEDKKIDPPAFAPAPIWLLSYPSQGDVAREKYHGAAQTVRLMYEQVRQSSGSLRVGTKHFYVLIAGLTYAACAAYAALATTRNVNREACGGSSAVGAGARGAWFFR